MHATEDISQWVGSAVIFGNLSEGVIVTLGSYSRSRYELENKCVIHSGCVVVVWSMVELFVEFDCCVICNRVTWLVAVVQCR